MSDYKLTQEDKTNFKLFLDQYYLTSINTLKFLAPIILGIFLITALILYIFADGFAYTIAAILGVFFFFRIKSIKSPDLAIDNMDIYEETGIFSTISNAGHRVMFNNFHAYNIDLNKLQQNGLYKTENVTINYINLRAERKMIYVLSANGITDLTLPLRK